MIYLHRNFIRLLIAATAILAVAGCSKQVLSERTAAENDRVLARADRGYTLTVNEYFQKLDESMLAPTGGYVSDSALAGFLDSILVDTLTGFAADEVDLSEYFQFEWAYKARVNTLMLYTYMERRLAGITVDTPTVAAYYEVNKKRFEVPEQVEVSHIMSNAPGLKNGPDSLVYRLMPDSELYKPAQDHIEMIHRKLDSGMTFAEAATAYSHEASAKLNNGYLGWTGRGQYHPPFDSIAFTLKPGTYSEPYSDRDGWHIIYVHNHHEAGLVPLSDSSAYKRAEQMALADTIRSRANTIFDSLAQGVRIVVNESLLDSNFYHTTDSLWFGIINDEDTIDVLTMRNAEEGIKSRMRVWNTTPEQKREVLNQLARQYCTVQAARRNQIDTLPDVRAKIDEIRHQESKMALVQQWFDREWKPSDSAVKAYFDAHPKEFRVEKPLTVQQIVTQDSMVALFIRDQARSGVEFMDLAKEYYPGEESIRAELADLGKIGPNDVDTAFYKTAFAMAPGQISEPVKTRYGFHIIKVLKHEDSRTLDDARVDITSRLTKEHQMAGYWKIRDSLYKKYNVKIASLPKSVFLEPLAYRKK